MRTRLTALAVALGTLAWGPAVQAAPISYGSFSGTVIDFDGLAGTATNGTGEALSNQFAAFGVTFDVPNFSAHAQTDTFGLPSNSDPNLIWVDNGGGGGGTSAQGININFVVPMSHVGLYFAGSASSTFSLAAYSGATLLETVSTASGSSFGEVGFLALSNTNITRVVASSAQASSGQNWNFFLDDLKYTKALAVPEPSTLLVLGTGLGLVAYRRRRMP